jgi:hypothetical protein
MCWILLDTKTLITENCEDPNERLNFWLPGFDGFELKCENMMVLLTWILPLAWKIEEWESKSQSKETREQIKELVFITCCCGNFEDAKIKDKKWGTFLFHF